MMRPAGYLKSMLTFALLFGACETAAAKRVALVIGNDAYRHLPGLRKAVGDARAVSSALRRIGFEVTLAENLDYGGFAEVIGRFEASIEPGDETVAHFSGHGIAVDGRNYLLPIDITEPGPGQESTVRRKAFDAGELVEDLRRKGPAYVFAILDACRNNPFAGAGRGIGASRGLVRMEAESGAFLLFSAGPGEEALDRLGNEDASETSIFTRVLLKHIETPGLSLQRIAKITQAEVRSLAQTIRHRQFPDYSDRTVDEPVLVASPAADRIPDPKPESESVIEEAPARPPQQASPANRLPSDTETEEDGPDIAISRPRQPEIPTSQAVLPGSATEQAGKDSRVALVPPPEKPDEPLALALPVFTTRTLDDNTKGVDSVALSPDRRLVAASREDSTVKLWDRSTAGLVRSLNGHTAYVRTLAFSPDGTLLASGSQDKTVKVWDPNTGRVLRTLRGHTSYVNAVAFSPDGRVLASGSVDDTVRFWNPATGRSIRVLPTRSEAINGLAFSPDGHRLATAGYDGTVKLWDVKRAELIRVYTGHVGSVNGVAFSPDGRRLVSSGFDRTVKLWETETGQLVRSLDDHVSTVESVAFAPDGRLIASGSFDSTVKLREADSGRLLHSFGGGGGYIHEVTFSADGGTLAGASAGGVQLWEITRP